MVDEDVDLARETVCRTGVLADMMRTHCPGRVRVRRNRSCTALLAAILTMTAVVSAAPAAARAATPLDPSGLLEVPQRPTVVVDRVEDAQRARDGLIAAIHSGTVVYFTGEAADVIATILPDWPMSTDIGHVTAAAAFKDARGLPGTAVVQTAGNLADSEVLDGLTGLVNRLLELTSQDSAQPGPGSGKIPARDSVSGTHYSSAGSWGWAGAEENYGWQRIIFRPWNLRNDGTSYKDYWVNDVYQETNPGANKYGTHWRSYQLRTKYSKMGSVLDICICRPNGTGEQVPDVQFYIGWPPAISIDWDKPSLTIANQSIPDDGFAKWSMTWDVFDPPAAEYYVTEPSYEAQVAQSPQDPNQPFSVYASVTNEWHDVYLGIDWGSHTNHWPSFSVSFAKPAY